MGPEIDTGDETTGGYYHDRSAGPSGAFMRTLRSMWDSFVSGDAGETATGVAVGVMAAAILRRLWTEVN